MPLGRSSLSRRTVRQAQSARETPEASIAGCFLLQSRTILIENGPAAAGDAARKGRLVVERPQKITFAEMRSSGVRGVLIYCADYRCSHYITAMADRWADDVRLSDIEPKFVCSACGKRGADVRPNFHWEEEVRRLRDENVG
jgi:hypothetical protein